MASDETLSIDIPLRTTGIALTVLLLGASAMFLLMLDSQTTESVQQVDSAEFESLVEDPAVFVLQVHTPYYGEIEGTDMVREDWRNVDGYVDQLPDDKETPIAIYCRSGRMSGIVAEKLVEKGYTNIHDLEGGMNAWESSGRTLVTG